MQITSVVLIGMQTTTHWVDAGVPRRLVLPMTQNGTQVQTTLPANPNVLPLGHYMLFAMVDDIPSNGVTVQVLAAATPAGRVPDGGDIPGIPLSVGKGIGAHLTLTWGASCSSQDTDYAVYEGTIGAFGAHAPITCSTGGATQATFTPGPGGRYYLVVPRNSAVEGSYGTTSSGQERPQGVPACLPRLVASCP